MILDCHSVHPVNQKRQGILFCQVSWKTQNHLPSRHQSLRIIQKSFIRIFYTTFYSFLIGILCEALTICWTGNSMNLDSYLIESECLFIGSFRNWITICWTFKIFSPQDFDFYFIESSSKFDHLSLHWNIFKNWLTYNVS